MVVVLTNTFAWGSRCLKFCFLLIFFCDYCILCASANYSFRFGIFPSWGLSQKLSRIIGPNRAREVSMAAVPVTAEQGERWGLVNHVVEEGELMKKAQEVAEAIIKNNQGMLLKYKSVINDGLKLDLGHALALEKVIIFLIITYMKISVMYSCDLSSYSLYNVNITLFRKRQQRLHYLPC